MGEITIYTEQTFLDRFIAKKIPVTVFLVNGFQMRGILTGYDAATILMNCDGQPQMLYKHAVSTVRPGRYANPGSGFLPHGN